jgi:hypothetical protein
MDASPLEPRTRATKRPGDFLQPERNEDSGAMVAGLAVCELGGDDEHDPPWDPIPSADNRCPGVCGEHQSRCAKRLQHLGDCTCRRCLIWRINALCDVGGLTEANFDRLQTLAAIAMDDDEELEAEPAEVHYDYYTGDPLDEDKYQRGMADEMQAMQEYGVYEEIPIAEAVGGKHIRGFPIAHVKGDVVRWRFVATEVNMQHREDNHQGTPPLMVVRALISRAASRPNGHGKHTRRIRTWDVRKAFFNAELNETIYVHPGRRLCKPGYCWWLRKALYGTRLASQMWGETVNAAFDDAEAIVLRSVCGVFYFEETVADSDCTVCVHGDDFLGEGNEKELDRVHEVLSANFEVTDAGAIGPGCPGEVRYLKRLVGYTETLPETGLPGFYWKADSKNIMELMTWAKKAGGIKASATPGTKATGANMRTALDPLPHQRAKEVASAGGLALYVSGDRPDTMFASKTIMQHVSRPTVLMEARLMRLIRYYAGHPELLWCYELQATPEIVLAEGDSDWAASSEELRRSTSGGVIRYGGHLWEAYSVTQATQALSSGEAEFYATGSAMARGFLAKAFLQETGCAGINLQVSSDSAAGRGICHRHGVGKVRHLELRYLWAQERVRLKQCNLIKENTLNMTADILTKFVEEEPLVKHCSTLNLRITKGLSMAMVFVGAEAGASAVVDDQRSVDRSDFVWLLFFLVVGLTLLCCGCCCGCLAHVWLARGTSSAHVYEATPDDEPRPAGPAVPNRGAAATAAATGTDVHEDDQLVSLYSKFCVPELKVACRLRGLAVSGIKGDLVRRLVERPERPSTAQAKCIVQKRAMLMRKGVGYALSASDADSRDAAKVWLKSASARLTLMS